MLSRSWRHLCRRYSQAVTFRTTESSPVSPQSHFSNSLISVKLLWFHEWFLKLHLFFSSPSIMTTRSAYSTRWTMTSASSYSPTVVCPRVSRSRPRPSPRLLWWSDNPPLKSSTASKLAIWASQLSDISFVSFCILSAQHRKSRVVAQRVRCFWRNKAMF